MEGASLLWLLLLISPLSDTTQQGQKYLTAKRGADVTLECFGPKHARIIMLRWDKPNLSGGHVIVIKDGGFQTDLQHDQFKDRVEPKDKKWNKTGDLSVILKYVTKNDAGRYECHAGYDEREPELHMTITLKVEEPDHKNITAVSGQDIALPCQNPNHDVIVVIEWKRADLKPEYVIFELGGKKGPEQHPAYKNRVELQDREMKDGNISLILKEVMINDTGTYQCHVIWNGTTRSKTADLETEPICIINLSVAQGSTGGTTEDGGKEDGSVGLKIGLSVFAVLLVAVAGFLSYRKCRNQSNPDYQPPAEQNSFQCLHN